MRRQDERCRQPTHRTCCTGRRWEGSIEVGREEDWNSGEGPCRNNSDGGIYGRVDVRALLVYVVGILVELPFMDTPGLYVGPVANRINTDISWLVGLAVTVPLYLIVTRRRVESSSWTRPRPHPNKVSPTP